jgi:acetoacetyl-CoA reductase
VEIQLAGKGAIVTGGGTGIGKAIAAALASRGARVAIASRNRAHLDKAADEFKSRGLAVLPVAMDVRTKPDVQRAVDEVAALWGTIHILINNAGISGLSIIDGPDDSSWYDILDTNLNGMYLVTKEVLRHMPAHQGGRVINISSVLGKFGVPGYTAYCTAKHGMIGFTRALALEVVGRGITVNAICPGYINTEMVQAVPKDVLEKNILPQIPIGRLGEPEEIARCVVFLASDDAGLITGSTLSANGGQYLA